MAKQAGPARAAGKLGPPLSAGRPGRIVLGPRTVQVETRSGTARGKKGEGAPVVEIELDSDERLLDFVIDYRRPSPLAPLGDQVAFEKRKTIDWEWEATIVVDPPRKRAPRRRKKGS